MLVVSLFTALTTLLGGFAANKEKKPRRLFTDSIPQLCFIEESLNMAKATACVCARARGWVGGWGVVE